MTYYAKSSQPDGAQETVPTTFAMCGNPCPNIRKDLWCRKSPPGCAGCFTILASTVLLFKRYCRGLRPALTTPSAARRFSMVFKRVSEKSPVPHHRSGCRPSFPPCQPGGLGPEYWKRCWEQRDRSRPSVESRRHCAARKSIRKRSWPFRRISRTSVFPFQNPSAPADFCYSGGLHAVYPDAVFLSGGCRLYRFFPHSPGRGPTAGCIHCFEKSV